MQFTLRRLFVLVACSAIVMAFVFYLTINWRRRNEIRQDLISQGVTHVYFSNGFSDLTPNVLITQPIPGALQGYDRVRVVEMKLYDVTPECIEHLSKLKHIDSLYIINCDLTDDDLAALQNINVDAILIWNAKITDSSIDTFAKTSALKRVTFKGTAVTGQGTEKLMSQRREVAVTLVP